MGKNRDPRENECRSRKREEQRKRASKCEREVREGARLSRGIPLGRNRAHPLPPPSFQAFLLRFSSPLRSSLILVLRFLIFFFRVFFFVTFFFFHPRTTSPRLLPFYSPHLLPTSHLQHCQRLLPLRLVSQNSVPRDREQFGLVLLAQERPSVLPPPFPSDCSYFLSSLASHLAGSFSFLTANLCNGNIFISFFYLKLFFSYEILIVGKDNFC